MKSDSEPRWHHRLCQGTWNRRLFSIRNSLPSANFISFHIHPPSSAFFWTFISFQFQGYYFDVQVVWTKVYRLRKVCVARILNKTENSFKILWRHLHWKVFTNIGTFVGKSCRTCFNIYKHLIYIKNVYLNIRWIFNVLWGVILVVEKIFGCYRLSCRSASYLSVIDNSSSYGPKYV